MKKNLYRLGLAFSLFVLCFASTGRVLAQDAITLVFDESTHIFSFGIPIGANVSVDGLSNKWEGRKDDRLGLQFFSFKVDKPIVTIKGSLEKFYIAPYNDTNLLEIEIQGNKNLQELELKSGNLKSLSLPELPKLKRLACENTGLLDLDLHKCPNLEVLVIPSYESNNQNDLSEIDLSQIPKLKYLNLSRNTKLRHLDLSKVPNLEGLNCRGCNLSELDLSFVPKLKGLYIDDNTEIRQLDLSKVPELVGLACRNCSLSELNLSFVPKLQYLNIGGNTQISQLDLSKVPELENLYCDNCSLSELDLSHTPNLEILDVAHNKLSQIDLSHTLKLLKLILSHNKLNNSLDLSKIPNIVTLAVSDCALTGLNISGLNNLENLNCSNNNLKSIDLTSNEKLENLEIYNNKLTQLDLSKNENLRYIYIWSNTIQGNAMTKIVDCLRSIKIKGRGVLFVPLCCDKSSEGNRRLTQAEIDQIKLNPYVGIKAVSKSITQLADDIKPSDYFINYPKEGETFVYASLHCQGLSRGSLSFFDAKGGRKKIEGTDKTLKVPIGSKFRFEVKAAPGYEFVDLTINGKSIKDKMFAKFEGDAYIRVNIEKKKEDVSYTHSRIKLTTNKNIGDIIFLGGFEHYSPTGMSKEVLISGATPVDWDSLDEDIKKEREVLCPAYRVENKHIVIFNIREDSYFRCSNNGITNIEFKGINKMRDLDLDHNKLTELDLTSIKEIRRVSCSNNQLRSFNVPKTIESLECNNNQLSSLNLSDCNSLAWLNCSQNKLKQLNLTNCSKLHSLNASLNNLSTVDLSSNLELRTLKLVNNNISSLDLSHNTKLQEIFLWSNALKGEQMTQFMKKLPTFVKMTNLYDDEVNELFRGDLFIYNSVDPAEKNICTDSDITLGQQKNWNLMKSKTLIQDFLKRKGFKSDREAYKRNPRKQKFGVQISYAEGVMVSFDKIHSGDDIRVYEEGSEVSLEVESWSNEYKLTSLTANGVSIMDTKKIVVTEDIDIEYTTVKLVYWDLWIEPSQNGTIELEGAEAPYRLQDGSLVKVIDKPQEGYKLVSLMANDVSIIDTKQFKISADTKITAVFAKDLDKKYSVAIEPSNGGRVSLQGITNLDRIRENTELTVVAIPDEGYKLVALIAGDQSIFATRKFKLTGNTSIKAIFAKETFVVHQRPTENGTITISGAKDLSRVAYGTELSIVAKPNNGYELKSLTANGIDIKNSKTFVVKEAVEVKAVFIKTTALEGIEGTSIKCYPNPVKDFVQIEGLKPQAKVQVFSLSGALVLETEADEVGAVRIDVRSWSNGTYIIKMMNRVFKISLRH